MDMSIRPRKFTATFACEGGMEFEYDVTDEIVAAGGIIPAVDPNGTDVLRFAKNAPDAVRRYTGIPTITVEEE